MNTPGLESRGCPRKKKNKEEKKLYANGQMPPERVAFYFGSGIGGLNTISTEIGKLASRGPNRVSPLCVPMMIGNMAAGMIAIRYNCQGPAMPAVTACASGSNAIGEALRAIRHGYADAVITGGAEASIVPVGIAGFINMKALSTSEDPKAASLPFDARRGGFVSSEEAIGFLWEDEPANTVTLSRYRKVALRLKNLLEEYGISEIVESVNGKRRIAAEKVQCDLYDYLTGQEEHAQLFKGSYLTNYSWGETTLAELTGDHFYAYR